MDDNLHDATARLRAEYQLQWEAAETFKAQELAAMTEERPLDRGIHVLEREVLVDKARSWFLLRWE